VNGQEIRLATCVPAVLLSHSVKPPFKGGGVVSTKSTGRMHTKPPHLGLFTLQKSKKGISGLRNEPQSHVSPDFPFAPAGLTGSALFHHLRQPNLPFYSCQADLF
jgi:hypothetical protein